MNANQKAIFEIWDRHERRRAREEWTATIATVVITLTIGGMIFWTIVAPDGLAFIALRLVAG